MSSSVEEELQRLRAEKAELQAEVQRLKAAAARGEPQAAQEQAPPATAAATAPAAPANCSCTAVNGDLPAWDGLQHGLSKDQIARYSRQIILHSFGVQGVCW